MSIVADILRRSLRFPNWMLRTACLQLPAFKFVYETAGTQTPITFDMWFRQEVLGVNRGPYWPVHPSSTVTGWRNILCGVETSPGYMPGCYVQAIGKIRIGDYTQIGPNVGLVSSNHDPHNLSKHIHEDINIGRYCWLGMGAIILPGVCLGDYTMVGAGSIVTKSFPEGFQVIAGNPARQIRTIDPANCRDITSPHEYHGFIPKAEFDAFRVKELNV